MSGTYVANITHFLDERGEMPADLPGPARKMASFLVLLIDSVTQQVPAENCDTRIRCRRPDCKGSIHATLPSIEEDILWICPACGHNGVISNWQGTKWNQQEDGSGRGS